MRKLALLLGSLVVVASASAKEVVPAPVVVEEAPVQIVEKEVIVYRDKEEGFRPNGFVDLQYRYWGKTENHDSWGDTKGGTTRTTLEGKIQMTEKQALDFRVRSYNSLEKGNDVNDNTSTQTRLRYYYNHGNLGDSKVGTQSFVRYEKKGSQELEYRFNFQLADYFFNNDFVKTTNFVVGPRVKYNWDNVNDDTYATSLGLYADIVHELPWGFSTEFELDGLDYNMYGDNSKVEDGRADNLKDNDTKVNFNLYLYHDANLYSNDKYSLDWHFEGGYDSYTWYNRDEVVTTASNYIDAEYQAYIQPSVTLSYQATEFVSLYTTLGAEYRNYAVTPESEASHWRWQPYGIVGFRTTF